MECSMCGRYIADNVWPKFILDADGEDPLCKSCWNDENERYEIAKYEEDFDN